MKPTFTALALLIPLNLSAQTMPAQTREELTPFCSYKPIWGDADFEIEECLDAAVACSEQVAQEQMGYEEGAEAINACVLEDLGIEAPTPAPAEED